MRSSLSGLVWPAVPGPRGCAELAILFQLEQSQWWTAQQIRERQFEQAGALLEHARTTVPFYRERLATIRADSESGKAIVQRSWSAIPVLTRAEVQAAGRDLESDALPGDHGTSRVLYTSGSTGKPLRAIRTQLSDLFWRAFTNRDHRWHQRDLRAKLATIRESASDAAPYPKGTRSPHWGSASGGLYESGPAVGLNVTCALRDQVEWLQRENPDYLLTHPSIASRLAEYCLERDIALPRLREVSTIAEVLRPEVRKACLDAWGVPVVDIYSAREAGYLALQCPAHPHYHVQSEGVLLEVLDASGRTCSPGEVGRVVVTPLHEFRMPLIRYEIGDFAEVGDPCPCGRGLPVLRRILGRRQNMLMMPTGGARWPLLSSQDIRMLLSLAPVRQYQFVQTNLDRLELRLALGRPLNRPDEDRLREWVRQKFDYPFEVGLAYFDELPSGTGGKHQDFICQVAT